MSLRMARRKAAYRMEMRSSGPVWRVGAAAVAMIVVAEAAVWLLRPRETPIQAASVSESDYFTPAQIDTGEDYSGGQLLLFAGGLAIEGAVLAGFSLGRPAAVRR